jgi:hypothetical protein
MANLLQEKEVLSGEEVRALLDQHTDIRQVERKQA